MINRVFWFIVLCFCVPPIIVYCMFIWLPYRLFIDYPCSPDGDDFPLHRAVQFFQKKAKISPYE